jgi:hypothetical protein
MKQFKALGIIGAMSVFFNSTGFAGFHFLHRPNGLSAQFGFNPPHDPELQEAIESIDQRFWIEFMVRTKTPPPIGYLMSAMIVGVGMLKCLAPKNS